jgi:hypothetical protein
MVTLCEMVDRVAGQLVWPRTLLAIPWTNDGVKINYAPIRSRARDSGGASALCMKRWSQLDERI